MIMSKRQLQLEYGKTINSKHERQICALTHTSDSLAIRYAQGAAHGHHHKQSGGHISRHLSACTQSNWQFSVTFTPGLVPIIVRCGFAQAGPNRPYKAVQQMVDCKVNCQWFYIAHIFTIK